MKEKLPNDSLPMNGRSRLDFGRLSAVIALATGGVSVVMAAVSALLFVTVGSKCDGLLNQFLNWHACFTLAALPFVIVAIRCRRERLAILGFIFCIAGWFVTVEFEAHTFEGDRAPPHTVTNVNK
jgi:ABC-type dipeptide/oligopeptide/nickel transport system permease subunit